MFGEKAAKKFVKLVDERLKLITNNPKMFRATQYRNHTYIMSLHKKATLTYRYLPNKKRIELVVFWGMQNPINKPQ
jgi:plasmid stabilization system protein ParE